jgi:hypothetical protein
LQTHLIFVNEAMTRRRNLQKAVFELQPERSRPMTCRIRRPELNYLSLAKSGNERQRGQKGGNKLPFCTH